MIVVWAEDLGEGMRSGKDGGNDERNKRESNATEDQIGIHRIMILLQKRFFKA